MGFKIPEPNTRRQLTSVNGAGWSRPSSSRVFTMSRDRTLKTIWTSKGRSPQ